MTDTAWTDNIAFLDDAVLPVSRGRILHADERPNAITLDVQAAGPALLVLSVTPHRYWRATIDGAPVALHRANIAFQAIAVPAGDHRIEMRYANPLIVTSAAVSAAAVLFLIAIAAADAVYRRRIIVEP